MIVNRKPALFATSLGWGDNCRAVFSGIDELWKDITHVERGLAGGPQ